MMLTYPKVNAFKLRTPNAKFAGIGMDVRRGEGLYVYRMEDDGVMRKFAIKIWKPEGFAALALLKTHCDLSEAKDLLHSLSLCYSAYINNMLSTANEISVKIRFTTQHTLSVEVSTLYVNRPLQYEVTLPDAVATGELTLSRQPATPYFTKSTPEVAELLLTTMQYKTKNIRNFLAVASQLPTGVTIGHYAPMSDLPPSVEGQLREKYSSRKFGLGGAVAIMHNGIPTQMIPFPDLQVMLDRYVAKDVLASSDPTDAKVISAIMAVLTGVSVDNIRVSRTKVNLTTDKFALSVNRTGYGELLRGGSYILKDCYTGRYLTDANEEVWVRDGLSEKFVPLQGVVSWLSSEAGFYAKVGSINRVSFGHLCSVAYPDLLLGKLIMTTRLFKDKDGVLCGFNFDRKMFGGKVKQVTEEDYHNALSVQYAFSMYPGIRLPEVTSSSEFDEDTYMHSVPLYYDAEGIRPAELDRTPKAEKGARFDV